MIETPGATIQFADIRGLQAYENLRHLEIQSEYLLLEDEDLASIIMCMPKLRGLSIPPPTHRKRENGDMETNTWLTLLSFHHILQYCHCICQIHMEVEDPDVPDIPMPALVRHRSFRLEDFSIIVKCWRATDARGVGEWLVERVKRFEHIQLKSLHMSDPSAWWGVEITAKFILPPVNE